MLEPKPTAHLFLLLLLLLCGDVELNPGPPRKAPAAKAEPKKELSESDKIGRLEQTVRTYTHIYLPK